MGENLIEIDGAHLSTFVGGSAYFNEYLGKAFQVEDQRGRLVALTSVQAERFALAILGELNPDRLKPSADDLAELAFPADRDSIRGMDLRDYFAAAVLQGMLAQFWTDGPATRARFVSAAYDAADAMLVARKAVRS